MDIVEIKKKQIELNNEISDFVTLKLRDFRKETGVSVESISIGCVEVTERGNMLKVYIPNYVDTKLAL